MIRPIAIGLSPNLETDDIVLAVKNVFFGKIFREHGKDSLKLTSWFRKNLQQKNVFLFNSGRGALFLALLSLDLRSTDEVIIPSFTCVAVPNAVIWAGAKPIFADISKENLGIDPEDFEKKITKNTKALIITHTFGLPADIDRLLVIAKKHNLVVIEDCAHCIKVKYKQGYLGGFSDFSVYSFGRDKAVSSVFGGALSVNNQIYLEKVRYLYRKLPFPKKNWVFKQHLHSILMCLILPLYNFFSLGKFILFVFQKASLLTPPVYQEEKLGKKPQDFPKKMPESLATLAFNQLKKIDRFNSQRTAYVSKYNKIFPNNVIKTNSYPLLRYPLLIGDRDKILMHAKKNNIILGNWYSNVVDPEGVNSQKISYKDCPTAYYVAQYIINLPTYPTFSEKDFTKVILLLKQSNLTLK